jgi:hypothetical protein
MPALVRQLCNPPIGERNGVALVHPFLIVREMCGCMCGQIAATAGLWCSAVPVDLLGTRAGHACYGWDKVTVSPKLDGCKSVDLEPCSTTLQAGRLAAATGLPVITRAPACTLTNLVTNCVQFGTHQRLSLPVDHHQRGKSVSKLVPTRAQTGHGSGFTKEKNA